MPREKRAWPPRAGSRGGTQGPANGRSLGVAAAGGGGDASRSELGTLEVAAADGGGKASDSSKQQLDTFVLSL